MESRRLHWPDCHNARDLGGLRTDDGGRIRRRVLIRTDNPVRLTERGLAAVRAFGVGRFVDLRTSRERAESPSPFLGDPEYLAAPFIDEVADRQRDPVAEATLLATYLGSLRRNGRHIAAGIAAFVTAPPGAVVVHCSAGKDRTGIFVALALRVAGVNLDDIAADYALTTECLRERHATELTAISEAAARTARRNKQLSEPETIVKTLNHVEERYGSAAAYLTSHGLSPALCAALRSRLRDG